MRLKVSILFALSHSEIKNSQAMLFVVPTQESCNLSNADIDQCSMLCRQHKIWPCLEQPWIWPLFWLITCLPLSCVSVLNAFPQQLYVKSKWRLVLTGKQHALILCVHWVGPRCSQVFQMKALLSQQFPAICLCSVSSFHLFYHLWQMPLMSMQNLLFIVLILS